MATGNKEMKNRVFIQALLNFLDFIQVWGGGCVQQKCFKNYRFKAINSEYRPSTSRVDKDFDLNSLGMGSLNWIELKRMVVLL